MPERKLVWLQCNKDKTGKLQGLVSEVFGLKFSDATVYAPGRLCLLRLQVGGYLHGRQKNDKGSSLIDFTRNRNVPSVLSNDAKGD